MRRTACFLGILAFLMASGPVRGQDMGDTTRIKLNESLDRTTVLISMSNASGAQGIGSGFVSTSEGWIVTNHHVIADPQFADAEILVKFKDGSVFPAQVVGDDPGNDLAVLKLTRTGSRMTPLKLGDSNRISVGQTVLAKGNPLGLEGTLSQGIISAIRNLKSLTGSMIEGAIQTDASIAQGNSGGPLVNALGEVIGVISAGVYNPAGGTMLSTINFAIPVNRVKDLLSQVHMQGAKPVRVARSSGSGYPTAAQGAPASVDSSSSDTTSSGTPHGGYSPQGRNSSASRNGTRRSSTRGSNSSMGGGNIGFGGGMQDTQQSALGSGWVYLGIDGEDFQGNKVAGVKVLDVEPNSPAARAGLRNDQTVAPDKVAKRGKYASTGHIITAVDGTRIESVDELTALIANKFPGDTAVFSTVCCDETHEEKIRVKLGWSKGTNLNGGSVNNSRSALSRDINRMGMSSGSMGMGVSVKIIGPDGQPQDPKPANPRPPKTASSASSSGNLNSGGSTPGGYTPGRRPNPPVIRGGRTGRAGVPYLGIEGEDHSEGRVRGVKVMGVADASPAKISGLRSDADKPPQRVSSTCRSTGHVIVSVNDEKVASQDDLEAILSRKSPGDIIDITVVSCGGQLVETIPVRLTSK